MATRNIVPRATGEGGIGTSAKKWGAFYALLAYIEGGTISGADITVGSGKTLDVSAGTLTLADDQISGDKIHGGTISAFASTGIDDNAASTAITIDSSERVGIGATAPVNKLDVEGAVAIGATYSGTSTAPTNGLIVEGNVGIGTVSPNAKLDIDQDAGIVALKVTGGSNGTDLATFYRDVGSTGGIIITSLGSDPVIKLDPEGGGSIWYNGIDTTNASYHIGHTGYPSSGTNIISALTSGNVGIGTTSPVNKLDVEGGVAIGSTYSGTSTAPTNGLIVEGNVGIGTASTETKLKVVGDSSTAYSATALVDEATTYDQISILNSNTAVDSFASLHFTDWGSAGNATARIALQNQTVGAGSLTFSLRHSTHNTTAQEKMRITSAGNVGIGTTSPVNKLDVEGAVAIGASYSGTSTAPTNGLIVEGNVGIGTASPTAKLHLPASTAAANTASLKITPGIVATTPVSGNIESDGTHLWWTDSGGTRRQLDN